MAVSEAKLPIDESVPVPPSVKRASEAADAIHKQAYQTPEPAPVAAPEPTPEPEAVAPEPQPKPRPARTAPVPDSGEPGSWEHRYLAMKGRFDQSQQTIGSMQEQMSELGDELLRTQAMLRDNPPQQQQRPQPPRRLLTDQDVQTYGPELLETIQRAARDAIAPDLQQVKTEIQQTTQKVTRSDQQALFNHLDRDVPNWRTINVDPRFKMWCNSRDIYSGELRGKLLNAAFNAAKAPTVAAFFQGFLAEEHATGQVPAPQPEPQHQAAPRQAAVPLDTLAAPGRAKPASGDGPASAAEKPVYTRAQISEFYVNVRKGAYSGRDQDKARDEAAIFAAQKEGRVR